MFKGLSGLKKAVKGGISAVAEHSSNLAEQVVSDPSTSQGHLKESLKEKVKGFNSTVSDVGENVLANTEGAGAGKEKASEVVHNIKHYGGFGEEYLGYSDPTKDLRKAVKQKEKAAKKARKEKKKKTGKKGEDLFDPENLAKYKREIEEKRRQAEAAAAATEHSHSDNSPQEGGGEEDKAGDSEAAAGDDGKQRLSLSLATHEDQQHHHHSSRQASAANTPSGRSPAVEKKEDSDDWKLFQSLTTGVDHLIQKTSTDLKEIKEESYFQQKEVKVVDNTQAGLERRKLEEKRKEKGKNWVDLESGSFEDFDGAVEDFDEDKKKKRQQADDGEDEEEGGLDEKKPETEEKGKEEEEEKPELFKEPSIDEFDADEDEDIFNTDFVTAVTTGEVKLAVIPDSPTYDDDEDDPFNTTIADVIVKKDKEVKKKEQTKLKFTGLSAVADVLAGKADKLDKSQLEHQVKKKRRRANRINLIADEADDVTAVEDLAEDLGPDTAPELQIDILGDLGNTNSEQALGVPGGKGLLATTPTSPSKVEENKDDSAGKVDLSEFEDILGLGDSKDTVVDLTSNIAILAGEFATAAEEEEDDFDAAFDALAHESVTKTRLEELEKQFENDDIFDTSGADKVLQLASLIDKVEDKPEPELVFEDPFDTSAYDHITGEVETELEFDSLVSRAPTTATSLTADSKSPSVVTGAGSSVFSSGAPEEAQNSEGWAAFVDKSKPPPRPAPPAPRRPPLPPSVYVHPDDRPETPSVVIKAPSTESLKSWNNAVADQLIRKSVSDALLEEEQEEEDDPFDTKGYEGIVGEPEDPFDTSKVGQDSKDKEENNEGEKEELPDCEDPFDTTAVDGVIEKSRETERALEKARQPLDLLTEGDDGPAAEGDDLVTLQPVSKDVSNPEVDPFDTDFAAEVLPDKGDPFDTTHVKGELGKAEIKALEEEFLDQDEFDPRIKEGTAVPKRNLPGVAGRARPKTAGTGELKIKSVSEEEEEQVEEDPFDTSIVDKVIPVRKAKKSTELSVEDDDFDPTSSFQKSKETAPGVTPVPEEEEEEIDPFDTGFATSALPEEERKQEEERQRQEELKRKQEEEERERLRTIAEAAERLKKRQQTQPSPDISDDDFDPRA